MSPDRSTPMGPEKRRSTRISLAMRKNMTVTYVLPEKDCTTNEPEKKTARSLAKPTVT